MIKKSVLSVLLGISILAAGPAKPGTADNSSMTGVRAQSHSKITPHAPDRVIVRFKDGIEVDLGLQKIKHFHLIKASLYKVPAGDKAAAFVERLSLDPNVEYAELDFEQRALVIPDDARFSELWGLHNTGQAGGTADADIDAPEAWDLATGTGDVVVGVIDTGVDYTHTDLLGNIWTNSGEIPADGLDNDGNGYLDDVHGINAITGSGDPMDDNATTYHGTHCAGTIGASGNNSLGVAGVCWTVRIMALKFIGSDGRGYTSDAVECIQYAVDMGAHVLSNSWGGGGYSSSLRAAIEAAQDAGILFMAAAGNDYGNNNDANPFYPASYDSENIIAVAATDRNDLLASFSNYGLNSVDVAAPGVSILSCKAGNAYQLLSGTSMATPHVSGLAALLKSYNPGWSWAQIKSRILAGVDPLPGLSGKILTGGRINAFNSLTNETTLEVTSPGASSIWFKKAPQPISWTKSGTQNSKVNIQLWRNGGKVIDITTGTANDGSFSWTPPGTLATASDYFVRITTVDNLVSDDSEFFTITQASITVTSPTASSSWQRGTIQTIAWTNLGSSAKKVKITLYRNGVWAKDIATGTPNDGSFDWKIPGGLKAQSGYTIRVKTKAGNVWGDSEPFTVTAPSITVTAPAAGTSWARKTTQNITWTFSGTVNSGVKIQLLRGSTLVQTIVASAPNNGSFAWTIPGSRAAGSDYKIKIKTTDNAATAQSGRFRIS